MIPWKDAGAAALASVMAVLWVQGKDVSTLPVWADLCREYDVRMPELPPYIIMDESDARRASREVVQNALASLLRWSQLNTSDSRRHTALEYRLSQLKAQLQC